MARLDASALCLSLSLEGCILGPLNVEREEETEVVDFDDTATVSYRL